MWQLMLCLLTANIVPAMITAPIQNIQELLPVSGLARKKVSLPPVWVKRKGHFCPEEENGVAAPTTLLCANM